MNQGNNNPGGQGQMPSYGNAGGNPNMMPLGMTNYGVGGGNMMGMGTSNNATAAAALTGMGMYGGMAGAAGGMSANPNMMMGMNMNQMGNMGGVGGMYGAMGGVNTAFGQQQQGMNPYLQQQMQMQQQQQNQQQSQSLFQTQTGYARPQNPPLPPGPPPPSSKDLDSARPTPPLPSGGFNSGQFSSDKPPPPPPPKNSSSDFNKGSSQRGGQHEPPPPPPPKPELGNQKEPYIPEQILKLLRNSETARQIQQATEALTSLSPLMALNVSQELFGVTADSKKQGIPGLDFSDPSASVNDEEGRTSSGKERENSAGKDRVMRVDFDTMPSDNYARNSSPIGRRDDRDRNNRMDSPIGNRNRPFSQHDSSRGGPVRPGRDDESSKSQEIVWELRSEVQKEISSSPGVLRESEKSIANKPEDKFPQNEPKILKAEAPKASPILDKTPLSASTSQQPVSNAAGESKTETNAVPSSTNATKDKQTPAVDESSMRCDVSDAGSSVSSNAAVSAKIPLESGDGKPLEYDRKTLKAFDKKFRDWEKQFENWKASNQNHPDQNAYSKYMGQWDMWRQQLIEQRRFIIDSMNQAKLEGAELAMQKLAEDIKEGNTDTHKPPATVEKQKENDRGKYKSYNTNIL
jgi:hypothetical protein